MRGEEVLEVIMTQMAVFLEEGSVCTCHLLLPALLEIIGVLGAAIDLKCKGVLRLEVVVDPIQACPRATVANFPACRPEWALAVVLVQGLQDMHHLRLIPLRKVLHIESPRHVHAFGAAMYSEEGGGLVSLDEVLECLCLSLAEGLRPWVRVSWLENSCSLPMLIPIPIQVNAVWIYPQTEVPTLDLLARVRVAVDDDLELAILQHALSALCEVGLAA
mmetsp:Transcript_64799/g.163169  ORF Transcript_64799/g.163169 Transcript_64799/m.163169 type:complete len:218 (-) Transcript_64799:412-1065(-)